MPGLRGGSSRMRGPPQCAGWVKLTRRVGEGSNGCPTSDRITAILCQINPKGWRGIQRLFRGDEKGSSLALFVVAHLNHAPKGPNNPAPAGEPRWRGRPGDRFVCALSGLCSLVISLGSPGVAPC